MADYKTKRRWLRLNVPYILWNMLLTKWGFLLFNPVAILGSENGPHFLVHFIFVFVVPAIFIKYILIIIRLQI
jgi:hypothetical protein